MGKRARVMGSTLRARPLEEKALTAPARWSATSCRCSTAERCASRSPRRFPLDEVPGRLRALRGRRQARQDRARDRAEALGPRRLVGSSSATGTTSAACTEHSGGPPDSSDGSISRSVSWRAALLAAVGNRALERVLLEVGHCRETSTAAARRTSRPSTRNALQNARLLGLVVERLVDVGHARARRSTA